MAATTSPLTFEEFERQPDEPGKMELLDGELIRLPPAKRKHNQISHRLFRILDKASTPGELYHEMGYKIDENNWLQADVSIAHPDQPGDDYFEGAPIFAVEVISESNKADDVDRKVKKYLSAGGVEVWVIYPKTKTVMVYRQGSIREFRGTLQTDLIPGLTIDLASLFA